MKKSTIKIGVKIKPQGSVSSPNIIKSSSPKDQLPTITVCLPNDNRCFEVDVIHDANTSKNSMFEDLQINKLVQKFVSGFNVTVIVYGHTGAGKTFCMEGRNEQNGIIADSIKMIYEKIPEKTIISCSYIQLYNQKIFDMLNQDGSGEQLKLRWDADRQFLVEQLTSHPAKDQKQMEKIWKKGSKNRNIAFNKVNDMSSRSHALFSIKIQDRDEQNNQRVREMTFVDLAGSERLFNHVGRLSKESIQINKSLFVLRKCIKILEESTINNKQIYVPYRDSKLTSLLKNALGGNCLTMMIACIDSTPEQKQQTLLTLSYAISTGKIQNLAQVNVNANTLENKLLKQENIKLKKQLETAWKQIDLMHRRQKSEVDKKSMNQYSHKIIECIGTIRELIKANKQLREELDEERKIKRQQKIEIQMLMDQKYNLRKQSVIQKTSVSPSKFNLSSTQSKGVDQITPAPLTNIRQQSSPNKYIKVRQIFPLSPGKYKEETHSANTNNSKIKRRRISVHKTEYSDVLQYRPPRENRGTQNSIEK